MLAQAQLQQFPRLRDLFGFKMIPRGPEFIQGLPNEMFGGWGEWPNHDFINWIVWFVTHSAAKWYFLVSL